MTSTAQGAVFAIGVMATIRAMNRGWLTAHCSACIPPIDAPTTACSRSMPSSVVEQPMLGRDHVAQGEAGKAHARLGRAVRGRGREAVADRVGGDHEPARRVERLARADQEIEPVVRAGERGADQDGVRAVGVERAVGDVGLAVVDDRLARFELAGRRGRTRDAAHRRGRRRAADASSPAQANSITVRMPSPRARPAKPSLISSRPMRRVIRASSSSLPSSQSEHSHGKSRFGRASP